jgi:hypothetical protein
LSAPFLLLVQRLKAMLPPHRLRWYLWALLLPHVLLFLYWETNPGVIDRQDKVRGRDFIAFYVYSDILLHGDRERLYDRGYFQEVQQGLASINEKRPPANPLYPPTTGILFFPLALMPYGMAIVVWWVLQAVWFALAFALLLHRLRPVPEWRGCAVLALAAFTPVNNTFWNGQLAALLLLIFVAGLDLHADGRPFPSGCVLSLLALKPQLAVGIGVWLLLRLDLRTLAGCVVGGAVQLGATALVLGTDIFHHYFASLPIYLNLAHLEQITPDHQHSLAGILTNLVGAEYANACKLIALGAALVCAAFLARLVWAGRRGTIDGRIEQAAAVLFCVFASPHLHTYDAVLLLIPITLLLATGAQCEWHGGRIDNPSTQPDGLAIPPTGATTGLAAILYVAGSVTFLYQAIGFSLLPAAIFGVLLYLSLHGGAAPVFGAMEKTT